MVRLLLVPAVLLLRQAGGTEEAAAVEAAEEAAPGGRGGGGEGASMVHTMVLGTRPRAIYGLLRSTCGELARMYSHATAVRAGEKESGSRPSPTCLGRQRGRSADYWSAVNRRRAGRAAAEYPRVY